MLDSSLSVVPVEADDCLAFALARPPPHDVSSTGLPTTDPDCLVARIRGGGDMVVDLCDDNTPVPRPNTATRPSSPTVRQAPISIPTNIAVLPVPLNHFPCAEDDDSDIEFSDSSVASVYQPGSRFLKFTRDYQTFNQERTKHLPFETGIHFNMPPFTLPLKLDASDPLQQRLLPPVYLFWNFVHLYRIWPDPGTTQYRLHSVHFWDIDDPDGFKHHGYIKTPFFLLHDQEDYFYKLTLFRNARNYLAETHPGRPSPIDHLAVIRATRLCSDTRGIADLPSRRNNRTARWAVQTEEYCWKEHALSFQLAAHDCEHNRFNPTPGHYAQLAQNQMQTNYVVGSSTYINRRFSHPIDKVTVRLSKEAASHNEFNRFGRYIIKAEALLAILPGQYHNCMDRFELSLLEPNSATYHARASANANAPDYRRVYYEPNHLVDNSSSDTIISYMHTIDEDVPLFNYPITFDRPLVESVINTLWFDALSEHPSSPSPSTSLAPSDSNAPQFALARAMVNFPPT